MRNALRKIFSFLSIKTRPQHKRKPRKSKGQSMVEFALMLPILLMLFSGMVEFGFMLNTYLSLLDSTRQAARLCSNGNPFQLNTSTNTLEDDPNFPIYCAQAVVTNLDPSLATPPDPKARRIELNTDLDDVVISVLSITVKANAITNIQRFKDGSLFYNLYGNKDSGYTDADITAYMTQNGTLPVQTGILIVEVYYGYKGVLKLPWVEAFMSDTNPVSLHASTIMPLVAAQP